VYAIVRHIQAHPSLELKTRPRFCPVSLKFVHDLNSQTLKAHYAKAQHTHGKGFVEFTNGLHNKRFTIVTYDHNDSSLYYKTTLLAQAKT
jgi:hypothetical protein